MTLFIIQKIVLKNVHKVTYTMLAYCAPDFCMALFLLLSSSKLAIATIQEQVHGCQLWHTHTCLYIQGSVFESSVSKSGCNRMGERRQGL